MSRWRSEHVELRIGADQVVLTDGALRHALTCRAGDWPALATALAARLPTRSPARARLAVTLADVWARYFLLAPPDGVASLRDCRLLLDARFEALYGQPVADWVVQADWQAERPMLACALPRALLQALAPWRLARVQPHLLALWNRHCARLPQRGALCASADGLANLLCWDGATLSVVRQQRGADIDALLALELARLDAAAPNARFWAGACAPSGWTALEALA